MDRARVAVGDAVESKGGFGMSLNLKKGDRPTLALLETALAVLSDARSRFQSAQDALPHGAATSELRGQLGAAEDSCARAMDLLVEFAGGEPKPRARRAPDPAAAPQGPPKRRGRPPKARASVEPVDVGDTIPPPPPMMQNGEVAT